MENEIEGGIGGMENEREGHGGMENEIERGDWGSGE